ncbi:MAG: type II toxin-antitoxin system RelE family toxin [Candidatus Anstonellales archaeon]
MYDIVFSKKAERDLDFLSQKIKERVVAVLERIRIDPYRYLRKLSKLGVYRIRTGDYRIIIDVNESDKVLFVLKVGHRKKIYKW